MRKSVTSILLASAVLATPASAAAWGLKGHRVVGAIADIVLARDFPDTRDRIDDMLGKKLQELATWPDCAKSPTICGPLIPAWARYVDRNDRHDKFHYTDVPINRNRYVANTGGTHRNDVVQILRHSVRVLRGNAPNNGPNGIADLLETEAVWVIAHLVGDIHQPMHVGAIFYDETCKRRVDPNVEGAGLPNFGIGTKVAETRGGGRLMIGSRNMHTLWDNDAVDGAMMLAGPQHGTSIESFARHLVATAASDFRTPGDAATWGQKWADEALPLARQAHDPARLTIGDGVDQDNAHETECRWPVTLGAGYRDWASERAKEQLTKAGFRLAAMLHEAMKDNN